MKKITSFVDGLLASTRKAAAKRRHDKALAASAANILQRAGRTECFAATDGFAQLERRQLMFGLTILPPLNPATLNQDIPGTNLSFTQNDFLRLPNQAPVVGGGTTATASFGYLIPFLTKNIQAFQQFTTGSENFDQLLTPTPTDPNFRQLVGASGLPFFSDYVNQFANGVNSTRQGFVAFTNGTTVSQAGTLRLSYRDIPPPATQAQRPAFKTPASTTDTSSGLGVVITNIGASKHSFDFVSSGGKSRGMIAARIGLYADAIGGGGGLGTIDFTVSQLRVLFQGRDVSADFQLNVGIVQPFPQTLPLTLPQTQDVTITRAPGGDPFAFAICTRCRRGSARPIE